MLMATMTPVEDMGGPRTGLDAQERNIFGHSREADWAIGGAALGFTAALVEFIENNEKSNEFSRKGEIRPVPRKKQRRRKFKEILEKVDGLDHRNAFHEIMTLQTEIYYRIIIMIIKIFMIMKSIVTTSFKKGQSGHRGKGGNLQPQFANQDENKSNREIVAQVHQLVKTFLVQNICQIQFKRKF